MNTVDSAIVSLQEMSLKEWDDENVQKSIRNRFVTGNWIEAKKFQSEIEKRAHNINPDLFEEEIQKDRAILEDLGAKTEDIRANNVNEDTLDWEYRLEQAMKENGMDTYGR